MIEVREAVSLITTRKGNTRMKIASVSDARPKGKRQGRTVSPEYVALAEVISKQEPRKWIRYEDFNGTQRALTVGQRLRSRSVKPVNDLPGRVSVSITEVTETPEGKTAVLAIFYDPDAKAKASKK